MNVNASSGPTALPAPPALPPLPAALIHTVVAEAAIEDRVFGLLPSLAEPAVLAALHLPSHPAAVDTAIHEAVQAIADHDAPRAVHVLTQLVQKQPESVAQVIAEPALQPIGPALRESFEHLTLTARMEATTTLAHAAQLHPEPSPLLTLANQFLETGQFVNYIRAGELGRLVIAETGRRAAPAVVSSPAVRWAARTAETAITLWRRAPLLVLVIVWLTMGFFVPGELWALGFLALVVLQFVLTVRSSLKRR